MRTLRQNIFSGLLSIMFLGAGLLFVPKGLAEQGRAQASTAGADLDQSSDGWKVTFLEKKALVEDFFEKWARKLEPPSEGNITYHMSVNFEIDEDSLSKSLMIKGQGIKFKLLAAEIDDRFLPEQRLQSMTPQAFVAHVKGSRITLNVYSTAPADEAWAQRYADILRTSFRRTIGKNVEVKVVKGASIDSVTEKMRQKITDLEMSLGDARRERDEIKRTKESKSFNENQFVQQLQLEKQRNDGLVQKNESLDRERESVRKSLDESQKEVLGLREEMNVYKTPLGEVKRIVKGLELPLSILPFALVAILLGVAGMFVFTLISSKRNAAFQTGLVSLGEALQNGLKSSQKSRTDGAKYMKNEKVIDSNSADHRPVGFNHQSGATAVTQEELNEWVQKVSVAPLALAACVELIAEKGNIEKTLMLIHAMPNDLRLKILSIPAVDECLLLANKLETVEFSKSGMLSSLMGLQIDLFREFGSRLYLLRGMDDFNLMHKARVAAGTHLKSGENDVNSLIPLLALLPKTRHSELLEAAAGLGQGQQMIEALLALESVAEQGSAIVVPENLKSLLPQDSSNQVKRLSSWMLKQSSLVRETIQSLPVSSNNVDLRALQSTLADRTLTVAKLMTLPDSYFSDLLESFELQELICFLIALSSDHQNRLMALMSRQTKENVKSELAILELSPTKRQRAFDVGQILVDEQLMTGLEIYKKYYPSGIDSLKRSA